MAFASLDAGDDSEPLAEINMVPLIDVMLVLLIIFMVTAPLLTHAVKLDLPKAASTPNRTPPHTVHIAIDATGSLLWDGQAMDAEQLSQRLSEAAARDPQPEIQLRADSSTAYGSVARLMSEAARHGLTRIAFVTDPSSPSASP
jgi:biopolymer transport protein ExbD